MKAQKQIIENVKGLDEIRDMMQVYEEVAAMRMRKIRESIVTSRQFYDGLLEISKEVGIDIRKIIGKVEKPTKEAVVFISANTGLYGSIIERVFIDFRKYVKEHDADVYILGRWGANLAKGYSSWMSFRSFELDDNKLTDENFRKIAIQLLSYEKIVIFYGKFKNIIIQDPDARTLFSSLIIKLTEKEKEKIKELKYLYEPTFEDVVKVFRDEVVISLFEQILGESQLAKFSARMIYLDTGIGNIDKRLSKLNMESLKIKKKVRDKRQKMSIAGALFKDRN